MSEALIKELIKSQENRHNVERKADSVIIRKPGEEPRLVKGDDIDRELVQFGVFLELCDIEDTDLIAVFDSRKSFEIAGTKYVFGPVMVVHRGKNGTECMTEEEICTAAIELMDMEVTLNYDGTDFKAYEIY